MRVGRLYGAARWRKGRVIFAPGEKTEHKDTPPLRCVAIRIRQRQETLFDDGGKVKRFAVVTNIREWKAGRLIQWHREKAGTVEGGDYRAANYGMAGSGETAAGGRVSCWNLLRSSAYRRIGTPFFGKPAETGARMPGNEEGTPRRMV